MKNFLILCLSFHLTNHIYGETAESLVRNNLKQIINNALDALVSLEDDSDTDMSASTEALNARTVDAVAARESDEVSEEDLTDEIRELERLLLADKNSEIVNNLDDSLEKETKKREESSEEKEIINRSVKSDDVKRSREEKATVVIDNDNLKNLVDLVVRTIDEEAKSAEAEKAKKEVNVKQEEKKDMGAGKNEDKKEVKISEKKLEKKEMCNTRKKECVQKKDSQIQKKSLKMKSLSTIVKKDSASNGKESEEKEIREMVGKILEGKNENVREALALLVENVLEKTADKKQKKEAKE